MKTNYMDDSWADITRDERFFCAELFQIIKQNKIPFNELLIENNIVNEETLKKGYEIGYEVCFYRDYIFKYGFGPDQECQIKKIFKIVNGKKVYTFPPKRTFDLCLFFENEIIIIEAKAQQGFDSKQLDSFEEDKRLIKKLLNMDINVKLVGLHSSHYSPKKETQHHFDATITWQELSIIYPTAAKILTWANRSFIKVYSD